MIFGTNRTWLRLCFCLLSLPGGRAFAEPPPPRAATNADIQNVVEYAFGDDQVLGDMVAPLGEVLTVRGKGQRQSLVRARGSFVDKLVRAVEAL